MIISTDHNQNSTKGSQFMTIRVILATLYFVVNCAAQRPNVIPKAADVAARIQRLEDQQEIQNVLLDYGRLLDAHDFAGYANLFAKDGEWVGGFGTVRGPAAIQAFMEKNIGSPGKPGGTYHILTNFEIQVHSDLHGDTATAWSRWAYVVPVVNPDPNSKPLSPALKNDRPVIAQGGHYDDQLVRENGHWKFKRREAVTDIPGPLEKK
jgi:uncharacterized protein (TIGR02246 family)